MRLTRIAQMTRISAKVFKKKDRAFYCSSAWFRFRLSCQPQGSAISNETMLKYWPHTMTQLRYFARDDDKIPYAGEQLSASPPAFIDIFE